MFGRADHRDTDRARTKRRGVTAAAVLACTGLVLAACGSSPPAATKPTPASSSKPVTITFANWASDESNTAPGIKQAIATYESLNPNVTIVSQPISFSNIGSQLLLEQRSGDAPDVAEAQGNYTAALAYAGALEPLSSYAGSSFMSSVVSKGITEGTYNGKFVATPWIIAPFGLWYNKTILAQAGISGPPSTISQLEADLAAIQAKFPPSTGMIPFGFDTTNRSYGLDINWSFMQDFGSTPLTLTSKSLNVSTPQFTQYFSFMRLLGQDNYDSPNQLQGHFRAIAAVNKVAFAVDGPYFQSAVQATNHMTNSQFYSTFGVTTLPSGPTGQHYTVPTDHQLVMFKSATNKAAAWKFMQWLTTSAKAITQYTIPYEDALPPLKTPGSSYASLVNNPNFLAYSQKIEPTMIRPPWGPEYNVAYPPIMTGVQSAVTTSNSLSSIEANMNSVFKTALASSGLNNG